MPAPLRNHTLFLLFVGSGFCGLLYQVVWLRLAFASFGIITPVLSVVVSVFMLGLAVGSWTAGRWIRAWTRRTGRSAIFYYAAAEAVIGVSAFVVPVLFRAGESVLLPVGDMDSIGYLVLSAAIVGGAVLPACIAMGMTFPLMLAFVKEVNSERTNAFSLLYFGNVIGASAGTLVTAVVLIELFGFNATLWIAASINFAIAAIACALGMKHRGTAVQATADDSETPAENAGTERSAPRLTLTVLFLTGFCSMGLEVMWIRAFTPVLNSMVYSFALLLFVYLVATWIGSWLYRRHLAAERVIRIGPLIGLVAASACIPIVLGDPRVAGFVERLGVGVSATWGRYLDVPLILLSIAPFCAFLGYLTPGLIDGYGCGDPRRAGRAYAINVIGCILGPLLVCYFLLPMFGARLGMAALGAPFVLLLFAYGARDGMSGRWRLVTGGVAIALLGISLGWSVSYEEGTPWEGSEVRRDHTATVISHGTGKHKRLLVNGVGITEVTPITKLMAHIPLAIHAQPEKLVVICFGMGTTYRSALSWNVDTTAVELAPSVRDAFPYYFEEAPALLAHPKGRVAIDDGRRFLRRTDQKFDVITIDPPPPVEAAGSSLLYSAEFCQLCMDRLRPGGMLMHWCPYGQGRIVNAVTRSLVATFPHVRAYRSFDKRGIHYICTREPLAIGSASELVARMPEAARRDLVEWNEGEDTDPVRFLELTLGKEVALRDLLHPDPNVIITDDHPFNEYYLIRRSLSNVWEKTPGSDPAAVRAGAN